MDQEKSRKRKANFTNDEEEILRKKVKESHETLFGKLSPNLPPAKRENAWRDITNSVNAVAPVRRDVSEIKQKWKRLKTSIKTKLVANRKALTGTGGGPSDYKKLDPADEQMLSIIGRASVAGIPGGGIEIGCGSHKDPVTVSLIPPPSLPEPNVVYDQNPEVVPTTPLSFNSENQSPTPPMSPAVLHFVAEERLMAETEERGTQTDLGMNLYSQNIELLKTNKQILQVQKEQAEALNIVAKELSLIRQFFQQKK